MSLRRFWLDPQNWQNEELEIGGDLFHHLHDVCRFKVGERFELLSQGQAWLVELRSLARKSLTVKRLERRALPEPARPHLHLALSVPRFPKVDWIVEKSVELGVFAIHPFVSEHSFVREARLVPEVKLERWRKLVHQATQQSGRGDLMTIEPVGPLSEVLAAVNREAKALGLFLYEGVGGRPLKEALRGKNEGPWDEIWFFIGSEGGFSAAEVEIFRRAGLEPLSLGSQVLRVETACLALASILKYEFEN